MRTTFGNFDEGLFVKVHHYTIVYYIIFNCGLLTKFSLFLEDFFEVPVVCHNLIFDFWLWTAYTGVSLILEKLFSSSSFYGIYYFSILTSGPHLDVTITSENIFRSSNIDAIIFSCRPLTWKLPPEFRP